MNADSMPSPTSTVRAPGRSLLRSKSLVGGAAGLVALASASVTSQAITVPNFSFEVPDVVFASSFDAYPAGTAVWGFTQSTAQQIGAFDNTAFGSQDYIDNVDGAQVAFMFVGPGITLFQDLPDTFQIGQAYTFTIGAGGAASLPLDAELRLRFYYRDPNNADPNTNKITIGTQAIYAFNPDLDPGYINHLYDYSVVIGAVQAGDAWAGKTIGIEIATPGTPAFAYWDVDNARVVPEPGTFTLLALGGLWAGMARRRSRRAS